MFKVRLDKLSRNILGYLHCLCHRASLNNQPFQVIAGRQVSTLIERFDLYMYHYLIHSRHLSIDSFIVMFI